MSSTPVSPIHDGHVDLSYSKPPPMPRMPIVALVLAILPMVTWGACYTQVFDHNREGFAVWLLSVVLALTGAFMGIRLRKKPVPTWPGEPAPTSKTATAAAIAGFITPGMSFVAGVMTLDIHRGRRLVRGQQARLVSTSSSADHGWLSAPSASAPSSSLAATAWRDNAATEHASISAFAHLSNQLLALGAPSSLVEDAHRDALDEINHARQCYGLAEHLDGQPQSPSPFPWAATSPEGTLTVASLAADAIIEACVLEGASARLLAALSKDERVHPSLRPMLRDIARDEARHALHGWAIIDWACGQDPAAHQAVMAAMAAAPGSVTTSFDERWRDGELLAWGIPSAALWQRCYDEALAQTHDRLSSYSAMAAASQSCIEGSAQMVAQ